MRSRSAVRAPVTAFAVAAVVLLLTACVAPEAFRTGQPTSDGSAHAGPRLRGFELGSNGAALAAFVDLAALRRTDFRTAIEAAVAPPEAGMHPAVARAVREADRVWIFVVPHPGFSDVVFVTEGASATWLTEYAGALAIPRATGDAVEYVLGAQQVAYRAPDTLVLGDSRGPGRERESVFDWTGWVDRLASLAPAQPNPELVALHERIDAASAPIWAVLSWRPELAALASARREDPCDAVTEGLLGRLSMLGASGGLVDRALRVHGLARAGEPGVAGARGACVPPELADALAGLETRAPASDATFALTLSPEALGALLGLARPDGS